MMKHFIEMLKKKYKADISKDHRAMARLKKQCEIAKRQLSSQPEARVEVIKNSGVVVGVFNEPHALLPG